MLTFCSTYCLNQHLYTYWFDGWVWTDHLQCRWFTLETIIPNGFRQNESIKDDLIKLFTPLLIFFPVFHIRINKCTFLKKINASILLLKWIIVILKRFCMSFRFYFHFGSMAASIVKRVSRVKKLNISHISARYKLLTGSRHFSTSKQWVCEYFLHQVLFTTTVLTVASCMKKLFGTPLKTQTQWQLKI